MTRPLVIAHRGASGERPENTMAAYERAVEQQADMIEIDLHLSRDGVIMIHHDAELERLGVEGEIADYTSAELGRLDAAPGNPLEERMPTLMDVLEQFSDRIDFNLEIKVGQSKAYEGIEERAIAALEERGLISKMLFSSFHDTVLGRLRELSSAARLAVLVEPMAPFRMIERAQAVAAEAINPSVRLVTGRLVDQAHAAGLRVYPYTEDDPAAMAKLLDRGVDGIFTNHPARLRALLVERGQL